MINEFRWLRPDDDIDLNLSGDLNSNGENKPYPCNNSISAKIHLFYGEAWKLPVDAIVVGQNETFKERSDGNESIFTLAGPEFEHAVADVERTPTGTSVIVEAGTLGCKNVILSVGPKYDKKYLNASISALHSAYRSAFNLALENGCKTLAFHTVYLEHKGYPRWDAAHVALRTIRKYLQHPLGGANGRIEQVHLCVLNNEDMEIYSTLLPAYFPRNAEEESEQVGFLPDGGVDNTDEWGAIVHGDRQMALRPLGRASESTAIDGEESAPGSLYSGSSSSYNKPFKHGNQKAAVPAAPKEPVLVPPINPDSKYAKRKSTGNGTLSSIGWPMPKSMTAVVNDISSRTRRFRGGAQCDTPGNPNPDESLPEPARLAKLYGAWAALLHQCYNRSSSDVAIGNSAHDDDSSNGELVMELDKLEAMDFIKVVGKDLRGRHVLLMVASNLVVNAVELRTVCIYVMKIMDTLRSVPYVIVYCSSGVTDDSSPTVSWFNDIFKLISIRYKENLQELFLLHASVWLRMYMWGGLPSIANAIWKDYTVVNNLLELDRHMSVTNMKENIPESVRLFDKFYFPSEHTKLFGYYVVK